MAAAATMVSSAGMLLAMLNETRPELKQHALSNLNAFVDYYWPEISTSVSTMYWASGAELCCFRLAFYYFHYFLSKITAFRYLDGFFLNHWLCAVAHTPRSGFKFLLNVVKEKAIF
ncbi:hypothetical protein M9H77_36630 [Catharanthus roseus]|uniref:Uncharacterized protein n=1 Tax=Catharanthus roseus TaxID=4058 RepID=A0ACB9ZT82_CATRO|nr:hypothetical protein M9H77_36630 [Catharanthus roseus]